MTGNFYCVTSNCARVVWREYLPPAIRYRYEGEDWQYVDGDDYTIDNQQGQCLYQYYIYGYAYSQGGRFIDCGVLLNWKSTGSFPGKIIDIQIVNLIQTGSQVQIEVTSENELGERTKRRSSIKVGNTILYYRNLCGNKNTSILYANDFEIVEIIPQNQALIDNCGDCTFKVYKNGEIVDQETRETCPEVEQLDCRLSDVVNEIEIEKEAYLERIEIRNQSIDLIYISPLEAPLLDADQLPDECLNIYNTYTLAPPILSNYVPLPGAINPYNFIRQICSAPGCPPPEYQVICDCDCESCPDGTCAVECGNHICCYDKSTGIAVQQIELDNYCGDDN